MNPIPKGGLPLTTNKLELLRYAAVYRRELRRHFLTDRERHVAEVILDKSWGWGLPSVRIPKQADFTNITGISAPHVCTTLRALEDMRVITINRELAQPRYAINPDSEAWKVKPRLSAETIHDEVNLLRELNGLPPVEIDPEGMHVNFKILLQGLFLNP